MHSAHSESLSESSHIGESRLQNSNQRRNPTENWNRRRIKAICNRGSKFGSVGMTLVTKPSGRSAHLGPPFSVPGNQSMSLEAFRRRIRPRSRRFWAFGLLGFRAALLGSAPAPFDSNLNPRPRSIAALVGQWWPGKLSFKLKKSTLHWQKTSAEDGAVSKR
jgi:hypothetical protein